VLYITVPLLFGVSDSQGPNIGTFKLRIVGENSEADEKADRYCAVQYLSLYHGSRPIATLDCDFGHIL